MAVTRPWNALFLPGGVPPDTSTVSPARMQAPRNSADGGVSVPSVTRSSSRWARATNLRMLTSHGPLTCADARDHTADLR